MILLASINSVPQLCVPCLHRWMCVYLYYLSATKYKKGLALPYNLKTHMNHETAQLKADQKSFRSRKTDFQESGMR